MESYSALVIRESEGKFSKQVENVPFSFLPEGEVLVRVAYAGLNYKDALSARGNRGVSKHYPHTPGVDAAGTVEQSGNLAFAPGDQVIVTSYDLGMNTKGGFAEYISVPASWVVPLPSGLNLREAMALGTAGFTAALALQKLELNGQKPENGEVLVSGASGGVGTMAVAILKKAGYRVIASSGKQEQYAWLTQIGAKRCINRSELSDTGDKPLLAGRWAGAIDTVGGQTLAGILKATQRNGNVAVCGLVGSSSLHTTVFPFILNGVNLLGVDSAEAAMKNRMDVWEKLSKDWKPEHIDRLHHVVGLEEIPHYIDEIFAGETVGRIVADLKA